MVSEKLSITRDGDTVKITYVDDKNGTVDIVGFDNIAFATPISEDQEKRNELDEGTSVLEQKSKFYQGNGHICARFLLCMKKY